MTRHVHGHIVGEGEEADAVKPLPVSALGADGASNPLACVAPG